MRGEDDAGPGHQTGLFERELARPAQLQHPLQRDQEAVAFVHVKHGRLDAEGSERAHAADAEHDLLAEAAVRLGHIEAVADRTQLGRVGFDVGVEQEERDPAHLHAPDRDPHLLGSDRGVHFDRRAVGLEDALDGQLGRLVLRIDLVLAAALVDPLPAEALPVTVAEEAHRHQRDAKVVGRLEVVAGQDAQPARIDRQRLRDPELEREVADHEGRAGVQEGRAAVAMLSDGGTRRYQGGPRLLGVESALHAVWAQPVEQDDGVVTGLFPELRIQLFEELSNAGVPGPGQVQGQVLKLVDQPAKSYTITARRPGYSDTAG